jgi:hypothetical protein
MKDLNRFSHASSAALLEGLGLQQRRSVTTRAAMFAGVVATGVVIGAVTALLFAPKSGRQLRADLRGGARGLTQHASEKATDVVDALRRQRNTVPPDGEISRDP